MIVCSCFGTTDREIRAAFGPGGSQECPAGQGCGNCMSAVEELAQQAGRDGAEPATSDRPQNAQDS